MPFYVRSHSSVLLQIVLEYKGNYRCLYGIMSVNIEDFLRHRCEERGFVKYTAYSELILDCFM